MKTRGVALCVALSKIIDNIFMTKYKAGLATKDLQFAFKENHSTILCTAVMKEIISHYIHNGSNVYSVLLDASKAFDKVHYGKLFKLLMDRNIPAYCIRFILDSYIR